MRRQLFFNVLFIVHLIGFICPKTFAGPKEDNDLFEGAHHNNLDQVKMALANGANINFASPNGGMSPLHIAALSGNIDILEYLLAAQPREIKVDCADFSGWTPLMSAVQYNKPEIVHRLLKAGAKVNQVDKVGRTPLLLTVSMSTIGDYSRIAEILLEGGASVSAIYPDSHGNASLNILQRLEQDLIKWPNNSTYRRILKHVIEKYLASRANSITEAKTASAVGQTLKSLSILNLGCFCLEDFELDDQIVKLNCGHAIHAFCLRCLHSNYQHQREQLMGGSWDQPTPPQAPKCPICRNEDVPALQEILGKTIKILPLPASNISGLPSGSEQKE